MIEQKEYEIENGTASKWLVPSYGRVFYTIERFDSSYIDLYDDEDAWKKAIAENDTTQRVACMPNVFRHDGSEKTFYVLCAIFSACGNLRVAIETLYDVFDMDKDGLIISCNLIYTPCK